MPRRTAALAAVLVAVLVAAASVGVVVPSAPAAAATNQFRGVNWADPRDNYADDPVVPSGLSTSDSYDTTYAKATAVVREFQADVGANTVRLPINPHTVNGSYWAAYAGAIDAAAANGFKVILSYWEGVARKDGRVDDTTAYWTMWRTVTARYAANSAVIFEPMNEPFGYSAAEWTDLAAQWIANHPAVPRDRIFVSGTGYNDNVTAVCADSRLSGTFLSLHHYGFWNTSQTSYDWWVNDLRSRIGSCAARTVLDEWGAPMTTGLNYNGAINGSAFIAYVQAVSDTTRALGMGTVYWPGLRSGDTYSMTRLGGSGTNLTLSVTNASGLDRLRRGWGLGGTPPPPPPPTGSTGVLRGVGANRCLDVPGGATANGTQVAIWDCNGGGNQSWTHTSGRTLTVYGNKCLDVNGGSTTGGARVQIWDCHGGANQQWNVNADGTVTAAQSGLCLDVTGGGTANGTVVSVWSCNGGSNQRWGRS
jgi:hypothetical protein